VRRWRAVIFDLDDTLYAERDFVISGFAAVAAWAERVLGRDGRTTQDQLATLFREGARGDIFDRWLAFSGLPAKLTSNMVAVYRAHTPVLQPFDGIVRVLRALRPVVKIGLLSDGYAAVQRAKFKALGISEYFEAVVFTDELGRAAWKPSPVGFWRILELLRVTPTEAVYIGDNCAKDFVGARAVGMGTVCVRYGRGEYYGCRAPTPADEPERTAESMVDLAEILECGINTEGHDGHSGWLVKLPEGHPPSTVAGGQ
jgi:putative hydrolase of the HAD superfamily